MKTKKGDHPKRRESVPDPVRTKTATGLSLLSPEDLQRIDSAGRYILQRVGVRFPCKDYLPSLVEAGLRIDEDTGIVRFPEDCLDDLLNKAPTSFTLFSRDGRNDIQLGSGNVYFANGGRVFQLLDLETGDYRPTVLRDVARTATLVDRLEHIHLYIIACQAHDLDPAEYHLNDFFQALSHTNKHVMGGCDTFAGVEQLWELVKVIAGEEKHFREKPFVSLITNPISPLTFDAVTLRTLELSAVQGIPVTCASAPISGATAPATLSGTLAQMHAESLAGMALCQVFAPGARVLYGAVPSTMDLRNMEYTMGSVEMAMMNAAAVRLAGLYRLPIYASAGVTDAKRPDIQAGSEKTLAHLMVALSGADLVHLAAGMLDSGNSIAYEQFAIDNELLAMVRRTLKGIQVDENTLGLPVIEKVGPGGYYLMEDHTVEHMMDEFFYPELIIRSHFDVWEGKGRPSMLSRARERVASILSDGGRVMDPDAIDRVKKAFPDLQEI